MNNVSQVNRLIHGNYMKNKIKKNKHCYLIKYGFQTDREIKRKFKLH